MTDRLRALARGMVLIPFLLVGCDGIESLLAGCRPPSETDTYAFGVEWTRVVQGNQTPSNMAPILADTPTGIEVLLTMLDGTLAPRIFDIHATVDVAVDDEPVGSLDLELGCVRAERSAIRGTIPGAWIQPGTQVRVALRSASSNVSVPTETIVIEPFVTQVPVLEITIVPLVVGGESPDRSRAIYEHWLEAAQRTFAVAAYDLEILPPLDLDLGDECTVDTKFAALGELWFHQTTLESERFFVGVLPCRVGGVAFTPGFVQVTSPGVETTRVFLHELGHNLSLRHAPCNEPPGVDPNYPYSGGVVGLPGFDVGTETWIPATAADLMGYCQGASLSDYHYARSARYRMTQERPPVLESLDHEPGSISVIVQGEVRPDGTMRVTHAARMHEPTRRRAARADDAVPAVVIDIIGRDGTVLVRREADLVDIDHVDSRLFSARFGLTEADGLAATHVRVSYGDARASLALVDGD